MSTSAMQVASHPGAFWRLLVFYVLLTAACIGCFFVIRAIGETLPGPSDTNVASVQRAPAQAAIASAVKALPQLLLALAAVVLTGRVFAAALQYFGQPPVIGEVLAGIALGPSVFHWFGFDASPLLPADVAPFLSII